MTVEDSYRQHVDEDQDDALEPYKPQVETQLQTDAEDGDSRQHNPDAGSDDMPGGEEVEDGSPSLNDVKDCDQQEVEEVAPEYVAKG